MLLQGLTINNDEKNLQIILASSFFIVYYRVTGGEKWHKVGYIPLKGK